MQDRGGIPFASHCQSESFRELASGHARILAEDSRRRQYQCCAGILFHDGQCGVYEFMRGPARSCWADGQPCRGGPGCERLRSDVNLRGKSDCEIRRQYGLRGTGSRRAASSHQRSDGGLSEHERSRFTYVYVYAVLDKGNPLAYTSGSRSQKVRALVRTHLLVTPWSGFLSRCLP